MWSFGSAVAGASNTQGVNGADLTELGQRAGETDIRGALAVRSLKAGHDYMDVEAASQVRREHFEEVFDRQTK